MSGYDVLAFEGIEQKKSKRSKLRCKISDGKGMSHYKKSSLTRFIVESLLKRALAFVRRQPDPEIEKVN
jgi:hypothetical protein